MINSTSTPLNYVLRSLPVDFPEELLILMLEWDKIIKSPYGNSYYNAPVGWSYKEHNSYRISDHWNFVSNYNLHCVTNCPVHDNTHWTLAQYDAKSGNYNVIKSIRKTNTNIHKTKSFKLAMMDCSYDIVLSKFYSDSKDIDLVTREKNCSKLKLAFLNKKFKLLEE